MSTVAHRWMPRLAIASSIDADARLRLSIRTRDCDCRLELTTEIHDCDPRLPTPTPDYLIVTRTIFTLSNALLTLLCANTYRSHTPRPRPLTIML